MMSDPDFFMVCGHLSWSGRGLDDIYLGRCRGHAADLHEVHEPAPSLAHQLR
jgi:hypothetical protein